MRAAVWSQLAFVLVTAGCAAPKPMYHWDEYQKQVYESLKGDSTSPADQLAALQKQAEIARAKGELLPPGFRAQVGLLKLRLGDGEGARASFQAEEAAFPESKPYMDFLLKGMREKNA
jgi:hypothetical protein